MTDDNTQTGAVSKLITGKYYGFVQPVDSKESIFFHGSSLTDGLNFGQLREGAPVRFRTKEGRGRIQAYDVEVIQEEQSLAALTGTILKLMTDRAFGFIKPDHGDKALYFHKVAVIDAGDYEGLQLGDKVCYLEVKDKRSENRAIGVTKRQQA